MATPGAIVLRRAQLQRDIQNLTAELLAMAGAERPVAPPRAKQAEHQQNNDWQQIRDTLALCVPVLREKLEGVSRDG